jgi:RNA polymerase primary sigma factor
MTPQERALAAVERGVEVTPVYDIEDNPSHAETIPPEIKVIITKLEAAYNQFSDELKEALYVLAAVETADNFKDEVVEVQELDALYEQANENNEEADAELEAMEMISTEDEAVLNRLRRTLQKNGVKKLEIVMHNLTDDSKNAFKALELLTKLTAGRKTAKEDDVTVASNSVQALLREAAKYPLLKPSQEIELAKKIERGDLAAKDKMVNSNLRLVVSIARRYQGQGLSFADLVQEGTLGLIRAAEKFDWRKGNRFSTYATLWIRQACQRGLENTARTIRLPVHVAQDTRKIGRIERELTVKLGAEPTPEEIAQAADLPLHKVIEIQKAEKSVVSLNKPLGEDEDTEFGDLLPDISPGTDTKALKGMDNKILYSALSRLTENQRDVLEMRFGLDGNPPATLQEIGKAMGKSTERIRQIEERALTMLHGIEEIQYLSEE